MGRAPVAGAPSGPIVQVRGWVIHGPYTRGWSALGPESACAGMGDSLAVNPWLEWRVMAGEVGDSWAVARGSSAFGSESEGVTHGPYPWHEAAGWAALRVD